MHLGFGGPVAAATEGFGALIADGEAPRVLGIIFESSLWPGRAPAGHTLLRLIYGGQRDPEAVTLDDATLLAQAERDVALVLGEHAVPVRRGVTRWRDGIAGMPVGHAARLEHDDLVAGLDQAERRDQPADAGADDRDLH